MAFYDCVRTLNNNKQDRVGGMGGRSGEGLNKRKGEGWNVGEMWVKWEELVEKFMSEKTYRMRGVGGAGRVYVYLLDFVSHFLVLCIFY